MWPIVWEAGSPDILSLSHSPSPSLTHQHQVAAAAGTPSTLLKDSSQYLLSFTPPLGLFLLTPTPLSPSPPPPAHMVFLSGIPSLKFTQPKSDRQTELVAFTQFLSPAEPILYLSSQAILGGPPGHSLHHVIPLLSPVCRIS